MFSLYVLNTHAVTYPVAHYDKYLGAFPLAHARRRGEKKSWGTMDAKARNCLLQHKEALEKDIKTSYIMDHMISNGVLTVVEEEKVKSQVKALYALTF